VRGHCEELIEAGRQWEIAEEVAARITVRHNWIMHPDRWRQREHDLMARWLRMRTTRVAVTD
jgi:hypothetical protein